VQTGQSEPKSRRAVRREQLDDPLPRRDEQRSDPSLPAWETSPEILQKTESLRASWPIKLFQGSRPRQLSPAWPLIDDESRTLEVLGQIYCGGEFTGGHEKIEGHSARTHGGTPASHLVSSEPVRAGSLGTRWRTPTSCLPRGSDKRARVSPTPGSVRSTQPTTPAMTRLRWQAPGIPLSPRDRSEPATEHRGRHAEWRGDLLELTQTERSVERRKSKEPSWGRLAGGPRCGDGVDDTAVSSRDHQYCGRRSLVFTRRGLRSCAVRRAWRQRPVRALPRSSSSNSSSGTVNRKWAAFS